MSDYSFDTLAIHAGAQPDPVTGSRVTPIHQTTSFVFNDVEHAASLFGLQAFGNIYTRITNPTTAVLEERVAALEGGAAALAVASGHSAQLLTFHTLMSPGDHFVAATQLYGGSITQFGHSFKKFDWHVDWADASDPANVKKAIGPRTKAVFIESMANPSGSVMDIAAIAAIAHEAGIPLIVDNTLASPYLIRPIEHGADIVLHSATKFLGGHGNSMGGIIVDSGKFDWAQNDKFPTLTEATDSYHGLKIYEAFGPIAFATACRGLGLRDLGPAISPFNAFMIITGIETLPLRIQRHSDSALKVAKFLKSHPKVSWVAYAGLEDAPTHKLQQKYSPKGAGAIFTFGLKDGYDAGVKLVNSITLLSHLANIGDTRSLIIHPASTTHRQLTDEQKIKAGAGPDTVRLSIGLEDPKDIIAALDAALNN